MAALEVDALSSLLAETNVEDGVLTFAGKGIKMNNASDGKKKKVSCCSSGNIQLNNLLILLLL